ncbi:response regulator transcription factor [Rhizobium sp. C1]|uniref:response regulator transcription factor n=1 Tax=Rhizobium sp. C1 TaxID=1349799 RepID=UPI001E457776|nr:response regulator [Rhizobium sp. C1]MCD2179545.1 response regulator [Rhizobium sp. C1]
MTFTRHEDALVYLVDDDEAIRDALAFLFRSRKLAVAEFPSGEALLAALPLRPLGCIVMDMRMDGLTGLETFDRLKAAGVTLPVVFLTGHGDVPIAVEALKKGAADFVEKPFNDNQLVDIVADCLLRRSEELCETAERDELARKLKSLSDREIAVLNLMLEGRLNKQIADDLSISIRTVEVHRARLLEKMGARNAVELAGVLKAAGVMPIRRGD